MAQTTLTAGGAHATHARPDFRPVSLSVVGAQPGEDSRRLLNVALAVLLIVLTAPLMLLIAVLVKLSSPGPVLYTQMRVGVDRRNGGRPEPHVRRSFDHGGCLFRIYKFRTMYVSNGGPTPEVWARPDDPRVTPVGQILRVYRLDELPQLFNVLRGDMNLVGPRPEQPQIFVSLRERIEHYGRRQRVLPGITGWAQVNHHYGVTVDDTRAKLRFDLDYLRRRSALEDLRILALTVPVVVFRRGAW